MCRRDEELVNKRCEYEVQATNGTEHDFPQIAQGLSEAEREKLKRRYDRWYGKPTQ